METKLPGHLSNLDIVIGLNDFRFSLLIIIVDEVRSSLIAESIKDYICQKIHLLQVIVGLL